MITRKGTIDVEFNHWVELSRFLKDLKTVFALVLLRHEVQVLIVRNDLVCCFVLLGLSASCVKRLSFVNNCGTEVTILKWVFRKWLFTSFSSGSGRWSWFNRPREIYLPHTTRSFHGGYQLCLDECICAASLIRNICTCILAFDTFLTFGGTIRFWRDSHLLLVLLLWCRH